MHDGSLEPLTIFPPIYLVLSEHGCWRCHKITPVISLATERIDMDATHLLGEEDDQEENAETEFFVLSNITTLPDKVLSTVQEYCPGYRYTYSRSANTSYFMNHCLRCDAPLGDFYMHDEPGAAFFPETEEECRRLVLVELPLRQPCQLSSSYSVRSDGNAVLRRATRKVYRP